MDDRGARLSAAILPNQPVQHMSWTRSAPAELHALEQIRAEVSLLHEQGRPQEAFDHFGAALAAVLRKNTELELLLAKLRRERLGTRPERISPDELALVLDFMQQLEPVEARATAAAEVAARGCTPRREDR